jgi:hypothetical protein
MIIVNLLLCIMYRDWGIISYSLLFFNNPFVCTLKHMQNVPSLKPIMYEQRADCLVNHSPVEAKAGINLFIKQRRQSDLAHSNPSLVVPAF